MKKMMQSKMAFACLRYTAAAPRPHSFTRGSLSVLLIRPTAVETAASSRWRRVGSKHSKNLIKAAYNAPTANLAGAARGTACCARRARATSRARTSRSRRSACRRSSRTSTWRTTRRARQTAPPASNLSPVTPRPTRRQVPPRAVAARRGESHAGPIATWQDGAGSLQPTTRSSQARRCAHQLLEEDPAALTAAAARRAERAAAESAARLR